ncbi:hypothetical protein AUR64_12590 [Haloprofundus marisrubri]|uniref:Metal-binding protein n=1 Tax=Haloprofundus marisrubri TaxID=1514971 RepID=A0A0W1RAG7_9EURY|nr:UPF0058 family protein [Haloprofundus marisrubri]KTG10398.1 hypothetical protein AUR64_12590 [Haloprofundus marisrubri]
MKKQELVQYHSLLVLLGQEYVRRGDATRADFEPYRKLGVTPMSLQASRADHEEAVVTLVHILATRSTSETTRESTVAFD